MKWILTPDFNVKLSINDSSLRTRSSANKLVIEIGPRLNFSTPLSTNAVSICANIGLNDKITRIEKSIIYSLEVQVSENNKSHLLKVTIN